MASPTEDDHFRPGIAALRASRADEAHAHFKAAIDAGLATTKSWLGLTLASLVLGDSRAAEGAPVGIIRGEDALAHRLAEGLLSSSNALHRAHGRRDQGDDRSAGGRDDPLVRREVPAEAADADEPK